MAGPALGGSLGREPREGVEGHHSVLCDCQRLNGLSRLQRMPCMLTGPVRAQTHSLLLLLPTSIYMY